MTNDGTQDPVPPPVLSDPLAGLVTGSRYDAEPLRVRVTEPPMPDIAAVREAMASVLDEDSELRLTAITPAADFFIDRPPAAPVPQPLPPVAQVPVAEVPRQAADEAAPAPAQAPLTRVPTRGAVTRVSTPPAGIPAPRGAGTVPARALPPATAPGERSRKIRLPRGLVRKGPKVPRRIQVKSSAGSVTLIMVLLLVMVVLGIVFLASLIDTIAAVFD
jgi:hypothetical protein